MEQEHDTMPPPHRDTDIGDLRPSALPVNTVTFADILGTHRAILGEMQAFRLDQAQLSHEVKELRSELKDFERKLLHAPSWVTDFMDAAQGIVARTTNLEEACTKQAGICRFHHPGNGYHASTEEGGT